MRRLLLPASLVLAFFVPAAASSTDTATSGLHRTSYTVPRCTKLYTVSMAERAARAIYTGTRRVSRHQLRVLGHLEHCQHSLHDQALARSYDRRQAARHRQRIQAAAWAARFTGYVVSGGTSTFGPPTEGGGTTADGGDDKRPCIALRDTSTLGHMFLVTIAGHSAELLHCDSGPYAGGREIDVTGNGAYAMGINPFDFPTDAYGIARELR